MNDDELFDNLVSMGNDPDDIEREYTDEELLQNRPPQQSVPISGIKPPPELKRLGDTTGWKEIKIEPDWYQRDGALGPLFEYLGEHPLSAVVNFKLPLAIGGKGKGWLPVKGTTAGIQMMSDPVGALEEALLPQLGQQNVDDAWGNTIWVQKMKNMAANPEDYAE